MEYPFAQPRPGSAIRSNPDGNNRPLRRSARSTVEVDTT
jgi:hypothetical protein